MRVAAVVRRAFPHALPALLALACALPAAGQDGGPPGDATELEPMTVTAPVSPLDRSLHLLRLLVDRSAPCLGCDAVLVEREPLRRTVLEHLLLPPDRIDEAVRVARDVKLQDSPDLEYLRP